ncbi:MAG: type II secretion system F family protein [Alphaproteobacteria bacterium]|nr:type II secretion system F family protein [Alphaproteobacteria bacterium]
MDGLFLVIVGLASAGIVLCLLFAFGGGSQRKLERRASRVSARLRGEPPPAALTLRRVTDGGLDTMIHRLVPRPELLRLRLRRTGTSLTLGSYAMISAGTLVFGTTVAMFGGLSIVPATLLGLIVGLALPHLVVGWLIKRRINKFETLFPEAIGLIVRGLRSGLPATESMQVVGREIGDPVGEEFRRITDEIKLGQPLEQALWETAKRIGTPEFNFLVVTMIVQRETGGNLAETLENLDQVLRRRRQMKLKIKAMSSEARASAMIIGSLPFIMFSILMVVNSGYVMTLINTHAGHILLLGAGCSMLIGIGIMAKLIRFEI